MEEVFQLAGFFCELRRSRVLRTADVRRSRKFAIRCLGLHPLGQVRPALGRLERLGVVAGVAPDLAVLELEDGHDVEHPP